MVGRAGGPCAPGPPRATAAAHQPPLHERRTVVHPGRRVGLVGDLFRPPTRASRCTGTRRTPTGRVQVVRPEHVVERQPACEARSTSSGDGQLHLGAHAQSAEPFSRRPGRRGGPRPAAARPLPIRMPVTWSGQRAGAGWSAVGAGGDRTVPRWGCDVARVARASPRWASATFARSVVPARTRTRACGPSEPDQAGQRGQVEQDVVGGRERLNEVPRADRADPHPRRAARCTAARTPASSSAGTVALGRPLLPARPVRPHAAPAIGIGAWKTPRHDKPGRLTPSGLSLAGPRTRTLWGWLPRRPGQRTEQRAAARLPSAEVSESSGCCAGRTPVAPCW